MMLVPIIAIALAAQSPDSLRAAIESRIAQDSGAQVAVAYLDRFKRDSLFFNADTVYHAASTSKLPMMMELFRQADTDAFRLDQEILLINSFRSMADGSKFSLDINDDDETALYSKIGTRVPVRDLLQRMITRSSNLATDQVIEMISPVSVTGLIRELGAKRMTVLRGVQDLKAFDLGMNNVTTARDLSILMDAILEERPPVAKHAHEMIQILLAQEINDRIPSGLPKGVRVAHKTGEITAVAHDAAIVYPPRRPGYVLVVLTRGIRDPKKSSALIADISRLVYQQATHE